MNGLALASIRSRPTSFVATLLSVFAGAVLIGSFATLLASAGGDATDADAETLITMASVVGGWGLVIVLFSVASTVSVGVRQRTTEIGRLRMLGALPKQSRRLLLVETLVVTLVACAAAAVPAALVGRLVFTLIQDGGLVSAAADHNGSLAPVGVAEVLVVVVALLAVRIAAHRTTKVAAGQTLRDGAVGPQRMSWWRIVFGVLGLVAGLGYSVITVTVMADTSDPYGAMSTAGPACVFWSIGLALLAPVLLRVAARLAGPVLRLSGPAGHLASYDATRRSHTLAAVLAPVIIFVGMGTGTLYLMAIENEAAPVPNMADEAGTLAMLNYVVVGMITLFAAIMVLNTIASVVTDRRAEFGRQRLVGATPRQVLATNLIEAALVAITGVVVGGLASLGTILPYSWVKLDRVLPGIGPGWLLLVTLGAVTVTAAGTWVAVRRALRTPALDAVGAVT